MKVGKYHKRAESGGTRSVYQKEDAGHKLLSLLTSLLGLRAWFLLLLIRYIHGGRARRGEVAEQKRE
jgi:hypothetical protein